MFDECAERRAYAFTPQEFVRKGNETFAFAGTCVRERDAKDAIIPQKASVLNNVYEIDPVDLPDIYANAKEVLPAEKRIHWEKWVELNQAITPKNPLIYNSKADVLDKCQRSKWVLAGGADQYTPWVGFSLWDSVDYTSVSPVSKTPRYWRIPSGVAIPDELMIINDQDPTVAHWILVPRYHMPIPQFLDAVHKWGTSTCWKRIPFDEARRLMQLQTQDPYQFKYLPGQERPIGCTINRSMLLIKDKLEELEVEDPMFSHFHDHYVLLFHAREALAKDYFDTITRGHESRRKKSPLEALASDFIPSIKPLMSRYTYSAVNSTGWALREKITRELVNGADEEDEAIQNLWDDLNYLQHVLAGEDANRIKRGFLPLR
eukprot:TRINITY_DN11225_c0_g1_i1.p1 TRINITY_DN11225_c0_g1~~TRINITY_DN11225_c0_g1_i1.p1  ORF type:complete len:375 (-),score=69.41 TRINITY_DN11225_c0_g1_i1:21-1145(-)